MEIKFLTNFKLNPICPVVQIKHACWLKGPKSSSIRSENEFISILWTIKKKNKNWLCKITSRLIVVTTAYMLPFPVLPSHCSLLRMHPKKC